MSTGPLARQRSASRGSSVRSGKQLKPPTPSLTPGTNEFGWEPCAATASFLLYAQRNTILCLHHDTLAIERRFERHREDVSWIAVDNVSERGAGRLVASYDSGSTSIIWDLLTGDEVARFASYEQIRVAAWMRNGNVAFGNAQGNIILFEPSTSEHLSARTIFDPITALAPSADCRTFAIGYLNGSILIATLQPSFTILHTLTTPRAPSPIAGLAWHGSSSKQKSEMLAAQTSDGDLRVWSVPKAPHTGDSPCVIRILNKVEQREAGPCWFAWSKNGRIVQYTEGQTLSWDVRTKRVSYESVPTVDGIAAIANYGPTATLFTIGRNHSVQQYDLNPSAGHPQMVANVQHPPANTPPSPPSSLEDIKKSTEPMTAIPIKGPVHLFPESESEGEGRVMSPLEKIAQEMDQLEDERRDRLGPLSPVSSRSSQGSRSSGSGRAPRYRYDRPSVGSRSSKSSGTVFSSGTSSLTASSHESMSIRTGSSVPSRYASTGLRRQVLRAPEEAKKTKIMDLFPFTKARLGEVPFRNSELGPERSPDDLRQNMLRVVFGWENDIVELVRDECARHTPGSVAAVLLSKWLGDLNVDLMASMVGSESMTSSDWMLLALSSMGQDSQKKVGEAFVQRLLEKGDIHPAVAILLGLGEQNDAIEVYVSRKYYMEAVLLTCLIFPTDWQRISFLVRKWGELSVTQGKAELAVKCFSCTGIESSEPWFSPRAQDAVYTAQKQFYLGSQLSPPLSPPTATGSSRIAAKLSSLKLVTNFNQGSVPKPWAGEDREQTPIHHGITPIAESAITPSMGKAPWGRGARDVSREPSSARTATPGSYSRRKRLPSRSDTERSTTTNEMLASLVVPDRGQRGESVPRTAIDNLGREADTLPFSSRRTASSEKMEPRETTLTSTRYEPEKSKDHLPSPAVGVFENLKQKRDRSKSRTSSRSRKPGGLHLDMSDHIVIEGGPETSYTANLTPPLTGTSLKSAKARSIDNYISSLDEANFYARQRANAKAEQRPGSRTEARPGSRTTDRARSRNRETPSEGRGRSGVRYIRPAKRSPSSPVPMSPEDAGIYPKIHKEASTNTDDFDDERYYQLDIASPLATESVGSMRTNKSRQRAVNKARSSSKAARRTDSPESTARVRSRGTSRATSRRPAEDRGRSSTRFEGAMEDADSLEDYDPVRPRHRSGSRRAGERGASARREQSPDRQFPRDRSVSRKATSNLRESSRSRVNFREPSPEPMPDRYLENRPSSRQSNQSAPVGPRLRPTTLSRKELAAKELEERRLSLARRPSAPIIPLPGDFALRPAAVERSYTDGPDFLSMYRDPIQRSQTADISLYREAPLRSSTAEPRGSTFGSTPIAMGLPANPRAMRHNRERDGVPAVPSIPIQLASSAFSPPAPAEDDLGPLLPATTYGLPATTYGQPPPFARSASAPPEDLMQTNLGPRMSPTFTRRGSVGRGHGRTNTVDGSGSPNYKRVSPPPITASIAETIHDSQVVIIDESNVPPLLAELQHLAGPPPPPPPPIFPHKPQGSLGVINIAIDEKPNENVQDTTSPTSEGAANASSPHSHRRGRGSVSDNIGAAIKRAADRMRSTSRSRNKSPPSMMRGAEVAPYESIPEFSFPRKSSLRSPMQSNDAPSPPAPPPPPQPMEQVVSPIEEPWSHQNQQFPGYRNAKEIRANMPPESLQPGVYQGTETLQQGVYRPIRANMPPETLQPGVYQATETPMI